MPSHNSDPSYHVVASDDSFARRDTAIHPSVTIDPSRARTKADEVAEMVDRDVQGRCFVTDDDDFVDTLFQLPDPNLAGEVLRIIIEARILYREGFWGIPRGSSKENILYEPFVNITNGILIAYLSIVGASETIVGLWADRHDNAPKSRDSNASSIRPDVVLLLCKEAERKRWEEDILLEVSESVSNEETDQETSQETDERTNEQLDDKTDTETSEETDKGSDPDYVPDGRKVNVEALTAWWLRVHVPVEMKRTKDPKDVMDGIMQLLGYMRQILREQVDRRFVFGLLFTDTDLSVWLCDRSGVFGMKEAFNIHEKPERLVQVILGLSIMDPERTGWDPTMHLCRPMPGTEQRFELLHSYDSEVTLEDYKESLYHTHWAITAPKKDAKDDKDRETFITIRALSVVKAELMCGRGTIVWEAVKLADLLDQVELPKIYVLKQCWRPETATSEGDFYSAVKGVDHIGELYSYEDVLQDEKPVDTKTFVRRDLPHYPRSLADDAIETGKRKHDTSDDDERQENYLHIKLIGNSLRFFNSSRKPPTCRVLSRLVLETYGWPVKFFRDLLELLQVQYDCISAHLELYEEGMVHRDVSSGNMIICLRDRSPRATEGRLIDLEYAKLTKAFSVPKSEKCAWDDDDMTTLRHRVKKIYNKDLANETAALLLDKFGFNQALLYASDYIGKQPELQEKQLLSPEDLGFYTDSRIPDYSEHVAQTSSRSATIPFASYEVLMAEPMLKSKGCTVVHGPVHDMEAFFWVLTYLCMTRKGPGGHIRDELKKPNPDDAYHVRLHHVIYCLFDCQDFGVLARNKRRVFEREDYNEAVAELFHPYFEDLKPLLKEWWQILLVAYTYRQFEGIHKRFLEVLKRHMEALQSKLKAASVDEATVDEDRRRDDDIQAVKDFVAVWWKTGGTGQSKVGQWGKSPGRATTTSTTLDLDNYNADDGPSEARQSDLRTASSSPTPSKRSKRSRAH